MRKVALELGADLEARVVGETGETAQHRLRHDVCEPPPTLVDRWAVDPGKQPGRDVRLRRETLIDDREKCLERPFDRRRPGGRERRAPPDGVLETGTRGGNAIRVGVANETGQALDGFVE